MKDEYFRTSTFLLGDYLVNPIDNVISRGSHDTTVQPKVMQVLLCLVANSGQLISKEYLLEHAWPGVFVEEGALRRCIFLLRKTLVSDEPDHLYLENVPRKGYRLLLAPEQIESELDDVHSYPKATTEISQAYRGLRVYESDHANIFFGRTEAVSRIVDALEKQSEEGRSFVLVLGPSGCGKSSLVRAGVLPTLVAIAAANKSSLRTIIFQLSESTAVPLRYFAQKIVEHTSDPLQSIEKIESLFSLLINDTDAGIDQIINLLKAGKENDNSVLLVFDQFEELFSLNSFDNEERKILISLLYALARSGRVQIIATMRSEFYPQYMTFQTLRYLKGVIGHVDIGFPGSAEVADIVRRPAQLAGFSFEADKLNRRLDQLLIQDATQQQNSLPLLQFALRELELNADRKSVLKLSEYEKLGNLEGCLSSHAERVFTRLPEVVQKQLPEILEKLVIADPRNAGRVLKRAALLSEFESNPNNKALIEAFVEARLVTSFLDKTNHTPSVQVAHEAVLLHWQRAKDWMHENYAAIKFRHWLQDLSTRWSEDNEATHYLLREGKPLIEATRLATKPDLLKPEVVRFVEASVQRGHRRSRIRRAVFVSLVGLSIASLLFGRSALIKSNEATEATNLAEATTRFLVSNFESVDPGNTGGRILTPKEMLQRAQSNIDLSNESDPLVKAAVLRVVGESYAKMGEMKDAEDTLQQAETLLPEIRKSNPRLAAQILLELGGIRRVLQRYDEAQLYLERGLKLAIESDDQYLIASAYNQLGLIQHSLNSQEKAANLYQLALFSIDGLGELSVSELSLKASVVNNLGLSQFLTQEHTLADESFNSVLTILDNRNLRISPEYSNALGNLGTLRRLQNRPEAAIDYYDRAIDMRTRIHGSNHHRILNFLANRISAELTLERYEDAVVTAEQGLIIASKRDTDDPLTVALLKNKYLIALTASNQIIASEIVLDAKKSLPLLIQTYGEDHPFVVSCREAIEKGTLALQPIVR